jgi:hypothetical protein
MNKVDGVGTGSDDFLPLSDAVLVLHFSTTTLFYMPDVTGRRMTGAIS